MQPSLGPCLILGVNGGFGRLFTQGLLAAGEEVDGVDLSAEPAAPAAGLRYLQADAVAFPEAVADAVRQARCVILCLPEAAALPALAQLLPVLSAGALLVDTMSVKTPVEREFAGRRPDIEYLSLNPLFSPELGLAGQNVAAVALQPGPRADLFLQALRAWGAGVRLLSAEEHDRAAAATQAATHCAILAYGLCLSRLGFQPEALLLTPPHAALLALVARITSRDPEVYRHIQTDNPFAQEARQALAEAVTELAAVIDSGDPAAFAALFAALQSRLAPVAGALLPQAQRVIS